jgi:uncharacterized membrane protein YfcA
MPNIDFLIVAGLAVVVGTIVQSGVGLGLGLVATPIVTLADPSLMPGSVLVTTSLLPLLTLTRDLRFADWQGLSWALSGRVVGTPLGVWAVAVLSKRFIGISVALMVLLAIGLTARSPRFTANRTTLLTAGLIGGATGTATSIGGPPLALLYQRESGSRVRATLGVFFSAGAVLSLGTLAVVGELPQRQVTAGLALVPFLFVGFALSNPLRRFLDRGRMRTAILVVASASALILLVRSLA